MTLTKDDVLALAKAGFTAQHIAALDAVWAPKAAVAPATAQAPTPATAPAPATAQAPTPAMAQAPTQAQAPVTAPERILYGVPAQVANPAQTYADVLAEIRGMRQDMQTANLAMVQNGGQQETVEDILAGIINPKEEGK